MLLFHLPLALTGTRQHTSRPDSSGEIYALPNLRDYVGDFAQTFRNRAFRTIIYYEIAAAISWGSASTLNVLIGTYVFEFSADEMAITLAVPSLCGVLLVWILLNPLSRRWQKPQLLRISLWGMLINALWLLPLKLADLLPPNDSPAILLLNVIHLTLFMFFFLLRVTNSMSIVADITDQHELEHGGRNEGGFFSVMNFIAKASSLIGPLYGGIVLDVIGLHQQDLPGQVAQPVLTGLMYAVLLIAIPSLVISLYYAYKIQLSKEQVDDIQATLRERDSPDY